MAKASEQMEKALKGSECVPEGGTELHRERLLSKLLDEAVVDGDPQTILLFKGLVRAAGEEDEGEAGTLEKSDTLKAQKLLRGWPWPLKTAIRAATRIHRRQNRCRQPLCEPQLDHLLAPLASGAARTRRKPLLG